MLANLCSRNLSRHQSSRFLSKAVCLSRIVTPQFIGLRILCSRWHSNTSTTPNDDLNNASHDSGSRVDRRDIKQILRDVTEDAERAECPRGPNLRDDTNEMSESEARHVSTPSSWRRSEIQDHVDSYSSSASSRQSSCSGYGWTRFARTPLHNHSTMSYDFPAKKRLPLFENPILIGLVTPDHALIIQRDLKHVAAMHKTLAKIYGSSSNQHAMELEVLTIVVDKLSLPADLSNGIPSDILLDGVYGRSWFWTSRDKIEYSDPNSDELSLPYSSPESDKASFSVRLNQHSPKDSVQFTIPLANTTFSLGRPYTMYSTKYSFNETGLVGDIMDMQYTSETKMLSNCHIRLDIEGIDHNIELCAHSQSARKPLTSWRTVAEVSGNVIKRLVDDGDQTLPASEDLEAAISALDETEQGKFEVWAELQKGSSTNTASQESFFAKVVGGGGGWGEKRGLIALDPTSVPDRGLPETFDINNLFPGILFAGDRIRFIRLSSPDQTDIHRSLSEQPRGEFWKSNISDQSGRFPKGITAFERHHNSTFGFGTTSSSAVSKSKQSDKNQGLVYGHFGAMSPRMYYKRSKEAQISSGDESRNSHNLVVESDLPPLTYFTSTGDNGGHGPTSEVQTENPTIRQILEDVEPTRLANTPKALEEELILANLKVNTPKYANGLVGKFQSRYNDLYIVPEHKPKGDVAKGPRLRKHYSRVSHVQTSLNLSLEQGGKSRGSGGSTKFHS